ncbi:serine/threonine protein kinase [Pseudonocardia sp. ICBG1122]|nr:serine/threonine protein kinase [Pseudonocardia pini]
MSTVLVPGAVVAGRYTVGERLGAGGMGVVHRARDTVLQRDVALKQVLLPDDGDPSGSDGAGPAATRRLRREAAVAAQLHHGRIVAVFDVLELDGGPLLVMEYVPAESLAALLLRSGPLPSGVAARIGAQVAEALAALHENGIVHRDVKPANVLVSADGPVKLTDFGIALIPTRHAHTVGALGTPAYFAPETARGADPAPPADVYSLGATLRVLTEGEPPYGWAEDSPLALIRRIAEEPVPAPSGRGPVPELLTAMTATDPAARPTAAEAARALWALADRPEPAPAAPAPGDGSPTRPDDVTAGPDHGVPDPRPRRRRALLVGAAVVLAAAAVVGTTLVLPGDRPDTTAASGGFPEAVPALAVGDQRTADPCLVDPAVLAPWGAPQTVPDYGGFASCDVDAFREGTDTVGVSVRYQQRTDDPPDGARERRGELTVIRRPAAGTDCQRYLWLADGTVVQVQSGFAPSAAAQAGPDPCAPAEAAAASAAATLARGVPRRTPPTSSALWAADACTLLRPEDLTVLPGPNRSEFFRDVAGWRCDWDAGDADDALQITLSFDRYDDPRGTDARRGPGTDTWTRADGDTACNAEVPVRDFVGSNGRPMSEVLRVRTAEGGLGTGELCDLAARLAGTARTRLG